MDKSLYLKEFRNKAIKLNLSLYETNNYCKYAEKLLENDIPVIYDINHLSLLTGFELKYIQKVIYSEEYFYSKFKIAKSTGGERTINMPSYELKELQRWILDNILIKIKISDYAMGFVKGKSIIDNATVHLNQKCIINIDLQDFFNTIKFENIYSVFHNCGYTKEVSFSLAKIATYQGVLPQGAPTSPMLSNIVCIHMDKRLKGLADSFNAKYSRYADDITFSGEPLISKMLPTARKILENENFTVNEAKNRITFAHQRQEVTGITINNGKLRINKKYKNIVKQEIYYCQKYGVDSHLKHIGCDKSFYKEHLYGKVIFIHMVESELGKKLFNELDKIKWHY